MQTSTYSIWLVWINLFLFLFLLFVISNSFLEGFRLSLHIGQSVIDGTKLEVTLRVLSWSQFIPSRVNLAEELDGLDCQSLLWVFLGSRIFKLTQHTQAALFNVLFLLIVSVNPSPASSYGGRNLDWGFLLNRAIKWARKRECSLPLVAFWSNLSLIMICFLTPVWLSPLSNKS